MSGSAQHTSTVAGSRTAALESNHFLVPHGVSTSNLELSFSVDCRSAAGALLHHPSFTRSAAQARGMDKFRTGCLSRAQGEGTGGV